MIIAVTIIVTIVFVVIRVFFLIMMFMSKVRAISENMQSSFRIDPGPPARQDSPLRKLALRTQRLPPL